MNYLTVWLAVEGEEQDEKEEKNDFVIGVDN